MTQPLARRRIRLTGAVQGVGMRPHVHRLASRFQLTGFVRNGADGVTIEVEGRDLDGFLAALTAEAPPLARIDRLTVETIAATGASAFEITESLAGPTTTRIVADAATCPACLAELFDPASRFFAYPFINCTHCGPRYTITRALPYDRRQTSMAAFPMCEACAADYADITARRFHAEPVACPACGPRLSHPISEIASAIRAGRIVALKGIGGFHLVCDARNESAVAMLRRRKAREHKPFAVMVENRASVAHVAEATPEEIALAATVARPIVLMQSRPDVLAPSLSPNLARVGVMLAYAPVHHLLFAELAGTGVAGHDPEADNPFILVATSANPGGEPLVIDDDDAARRLGAIADLVVSHDRAIVVRSDDSVAQVISRAPAYLRRARGYVPEPIELATDGPVTLAVGAHLKNTVTLTRGREAFVSQHVGDLDTAETMRYFREVIDHLTSIVGVQPEQIACDLHPDYRSTQFADMTGLPVARVQHHVAHVAAIAAEHQLDGPLIGLALDGHGLGSDGSAWGGEGLLLEADGRWRRIGHLASIPLPGGDRAAREPWRMAVGALSDLGLSSEIPRLFPTAPLARPLADRLARGLETTRTTSLGRLFDAVAGLSGLRGVQDYEGQAAMELEALVDEPTELAGGWTLESGELSFSPLLRHVALMSPGPRTAANLLHGTLIAGLTALSIEMSRLSGLTTVALGGGCLVNRTLAEGLSARLVNHNLKPLLARKLPPNDGGLSLGQAVLARSDFFQET